MNTEPTGGIHDGDAEDSQLHEWLARRFDTQLAQARRDYPRLDVGRAGTERPARFQSIGQLSKLAGVVAAVGILAVVGLIGVGLGTQTTPAARPNPAPVQTTIPPTIDGQKVYRGVDQATFPASGSFLLGGVFSKPEVVPPCPAQIDLTAAEQQLIPYCYILSIDGLYLAPKSNIDEPRGEFVVARAHLNDPLAAQCPAKTQAECKASIVVESVIWSAPGDSVATPSAEVSAGASGGVSTGAISVPSPVAAGSGEGGGPVNAPPIVVLGQDGVPVSYNSETVYRAANLTSGGTLLGGPLARAGNAWTIDGLAVGSTRAVLDPMTGSVVVARIASSWPATSCAAGPCRNSPPAIIVLEILWSGPPAPAAPPVPMPPASPAGS